MAKAPRQSLQGELSYFATALNLGQPGPRGRGDRDDPQPDNGGV